MRKGVHIYTEQEIEQASGTEKERGQWWNEKAKEMCENPQCDMLRGEAINQRLYKEWKIHKAEKMAEEEMQTREATEAILEECPNLQGLVDRKSKSKQGKHGHETSSVWSWQCKLQEEARTRSRS